MGPRRIGIKSADSLFDGHRFRALTIIDNYGRECLAIEAGQSMKGAERATVVERLVTERGAPERIQCDNGTEFISRPLDKWAYENGVTMDFSRPGKPMDNAMIESFNGTFRDECLNQSWGEARSSKILTHWLDRFDGGKSVFNFRRKAMTRCLTNYFFYGYME